MAKITKSTKKFLVKKGKESRNGKQRKSKAFGGRNGGHHNGGKKRENGLGGEKENTVPEGVSGDEDVSEDDEDYSETAGFTTTTTDGMENTSSSEDEDTDEGDDDDSANDSDLDSINSNSNDAQDDDEEIDMGINMKELQQSDPKFYQYLVENDQKLLEFDNIQDNHDTSLPLQDDSQEEGDEKGDDMDENVDEMDLDHDDSLVTRQQIHQWRISIAKTFSIKTLKKIVLAFKAAAAFGDEQEIQDSLRYRIEDEKVLNLTLLTAIKYSPLVLNHYLYGGEEEEGHEGQEQDDPVMPSKKALPSSLSKWKKVKVICKSFLASLLQVQKKMTSLSMTKFIIKATEQTVAYYACFPKLCKDFLRQLLLLWSSSAHDEQIRILAFMCMRRLAMTCPKTYLDKTLKSAYRTFLEKSRETTHYTTTQISFMQNCLVELYGLYVPAAYQHGFVGLRELAIKLRQATTQPSPETVRQVYNWQYLHALRLWAVVFGMYGGGAEGGDEGVRPLVYPLVQIVMGVIRLKPSSKHFPLRLHLVTLLTQIMESTSIFIPTSALLLEIFDSNELKSKGKPSTLKPLDFNGCIRAPSQYLGTKTYQAGLVEQVMGGLYRGYTCMARSIAFPEMVVAVVLRMRKIVKEGKVGVAGTRQMQMFIEKMEQHAKVVEGERGKIEFGPQDSKAVKSFMADMEDDQLPLIKYYESRRKVMAKQAAAKEENQEEKAVADAVPAEKKADGKKTGAVGKKESNKMGEDGFEGDQDLVEDFTLSSDEEDQDQDDE